ncbi:helix-turn-helix domain-containing protein [Aquifex aeolicus]|nr:helix-turn-helix domain-containing protein [Aquifex aeolicus]
MKLLLEYDYPGNVRELENAIEHAVVVSSTSLIGPDDLPEEIRIGSKVKKKFRENEELEKIKEALERAGGNKSLAAKLLGIHRTTLWRKLKEYGLA